MRRVRENTSVTSTTTGHDQDTVKSQVIRKQRPRFLALAAILIFPGLVLDCRGEEQAQLDQPAQETSGRPSGRWHETPSAQPAEEMDPELQELENNLQALGYLGDTKVKTAREGVTVHDRAKSSDGLNLYISGHRPEAHLINMDGEVLHSWRYDFEDVWTRDTFVGRTRIRGREYWRRVHLSENGDLIANFEYLGLIKIDKDSNLLWAAPCRAHHDLEVAENGDIHTLTRRETTMTLEGERFDTIVDDVLLLDHEGREKRRVSLLDAFDASGLHHMWRDHFDGKRSVFHTNAIRLLDGSSHIPEFADGNLLLSMANINTIAVIDPNEQRVVWSHQNEFRSQHDPRMLPDGRILLFDNKGTPKRSRVLAIDPETGHTTVVYEGSEAAPFYTGSCGTSRRLPNGNTLICESDKGRAIEVTIDGEIIWEFLNPHRAGENREYVATLFDIIRLAPDFPADWAAGPSPR